MLGTIPIAVLVGFAFKNVIEDELRSLELIATVMILVSARPVRSPTARHA